MGTSASMAGGILTISGGILTALTGTATATFISVLRIRDVYPGSRIRLFSIPDPNFFISDPHQRIWLGYFNPKNCFLRSRKYDPVCSSWIRILIFYPSRIPDLGVKKAPDPVSGSVTLIYIHSQGCGSGLGWVWIFFGKCSYFTLILEKCHFKFFFYSLDFSPQEETLSFTGCGR